MSDRRSAKPPLTPPIPSSSAIGVGGLGPNDVLCGRGTPLIRFVGNCRFRKLVKEHMRQYLAANARRGERDRVVKQVLDTIITERGGRFLRQPPGSEATASSVSIGTSRWELVSETIATRKVKQAFRDSLNKHSWAERSVEPPVGQVEHAEALAASVSAALVAVPPQLPQQPQQDLSSQTAFLLAAHLLQQQSRQLQADSAYRQQAILLQQMQHHHQSQAHQQRVQQQTALVLRSLAIFLVASSPAAPPPPPPQGPRQMESSRLGAELPPSVCRHQEKRVADAAQAPRTEEPAPNSSAVAQREVVKVAAQQGTKDHAVPCPPRAIAQPSHLALASTTSLVRPGAKKEDQQVAQQNPPVDAQTQSMSGRAQNDRGKAVREEESDTSPLDQLASAAAKMDSLP